MIRGRHHIEEIRRDREAIVFTEIPYQVNKSRLFERIAETMREKIIEGIADLRDESDRDGVRVVIELKRDADGRYGAGRSCFALPRCKQASPSMRWY